METNDIDARRQQLHQRAKWAIGLGAALIFAPALFTLAQALLGATIAIGATLVIGTAAISFAPVWSMKLANWRIKAITAEASANPIETLKSLYIEKRKELQASSEAICDFEAEIANFNDQLEDFKKRPDCADEVPRYTDISGRMQHGLALMKNRQREAEGAIDNLAHQISKAEAIYKMALAARRVTMLSGSAEQQVFAEIKEKVALDSVRTNLNRSFAALNASIEARERPQLTVGQMGETAH